MSKLDVTADITSMNSTVRNYQVDSGHIDSDSGSEEQTWDYPESNHRLGYYNLLPELKKSIDILAMYTVGKGYTTDPRTQKMLENITGWGEDTFESLMWNMVVQKKVFGDAFSEIIRDDAGNIINIKPLYTGDMKVITNKKGLIIRYEQTSATNKAPIKFQPYEILHLVNDRLANQIHGTSVVDSVKWVIDAKNEALDTMRKIMRRQLAMGILYIDSEDETDIKSVQEKYQGAVNSNDVLVLPKDVAKIEQAPANQTIGSLQTWIQYLDDFSYRALGVPLVLAGGSGGSEGSDKTGFLTFDQVYLKEARELQSDLWNQAAIKVEFTKPASIQPNIQLDQTKNTSQTGFQEKEVTASVERE